MKVLAVTTEPITADALRDALPEDVDPTEVEVMVVAPALHSSALRFWVSDADEAITRAEQVRRESLDELGDQGVAAAADTGEGDIEEALEDALQTFDADRIVVFIHPEEERRYREDVAEDELRERFGLPVDRAEIASSSD
ncbi:MAG: hypothetical protein QOF83_1230 [Solirubrobacteraceae bacterium]|jgi:hypothetical protein|nr:hypothetical protein [Solirubrobacteraceae bacterium]